MDFSQGPALAAVIPHATSVSSVSYHQDGNHLFVATKDDSKLYVVNCQTGTLLNDPNQNQNQQQQQQQQQQYPYLKNEKDGIDLVCATHHDYSVLTAGRNSNVVNYWSVYDNKLLRKFRGHSGPIHDMSVCPVEDLFLTASNDQTVRLWNMSQAGCIGQMDLPKDKTTGKPFVAFDSTGMVFAVLAAQQQQQQQPFSSSVDGGGTGGYYIHLYDARNFQGGAFSEMFVTNASLQQGMTTHRIPPPPPPPPMSTTTSTSTSNNTIVLNKIDFNGSGNRILVQSEQGPTFVLDGYEGTVQRVFAPSNTLSTGIVSSCFTPDDQYVLLGTENGTVDCYDIVSGALVRNMTAGNNTATATTTSRNNSHGIHTIACNPKYKQIVSSCHNNTCLWLW
ncbi:anaphase-promoting complex subunit 11 RING-H2 finger-domain containing protein [Nitzschia inconspicua]|uniref:Anaphase-promoting complex subunit 11 RING-H2 finger-domain containing protein n=1 Tax=Nitzschia inconspicua TaxID=303405 RepID=A0A9K3KAZ1_9STRA|nr:anaphase-promoting complex subunit 11 RING-H2 finger-domain containing protein [Nitzschia inconspicua]